MPLLLQTDSSANGDAFRYLGSLSTITIRGDDFGSGFVAIEAKFSGDDEWTKLGNNSGITDFTSDVNLNLELGSGVLIRGTLQGAETASNVIIKISGNIDPNPVT